jgi:hypothetical protein
MGRGFQWDKCRDARTVLRHGATVLDDKDRVLGILAFRRKRAKKKKPQPSTSTTIKWHTEYLESGAQYKMSFASFKSRKTKEWAKAKQKRKSS